jgi:hypothetical protein
MGHFSIRREEYIIGMVLNRFRMDRFIAKKSCPDAACTHFYVPVP